MLTAEQTSLICPCNDLESKTILDIGQRLGLDVHAIVGKWGLTLEMALAQLLQPLSLREQVIVVELPGSVGLAQLQYLGKQVYSIDHHQTSRSAPQERSSSLEQFAQLLGYSLTQEEWEIAINDRDFLPGLSHAGISLERARALRQAELELRGQVENMKSAQDYLVSHPARDLDDLRLVLAPIQYAGVMLEAAQWPSDEVYQDAAFKREPVTLKAVLILYHAAYSHQYIEQIEYAGPAQHREGLAALFAEPFWSNDFNMWLGGGQYGCFWGAGRKHSGAKVDDLVSRLLGMTLHTGRPLRHYHCTFYLPLDLFLDKDLVKHSKLKIFSPHPENVERHQFDPAQKVLKDESDSPKAYEKQAYLYFLPHLRDMIFGTSTATSMRPLERWRLRELGEMKLYLGDETSTTHVQVTDVSLYCYFNELYLLAISVEPNIRLAPESSLHRDRTNWWHDLFFADEKLFKEIQGLQMALWLRFTHQARIIYPSFREQIQENKITQMMLITDQQKIKFNQNDELSSVILFLLGYFFSEQSLQERLRYLPDDRMMVSPAYGLAGIAPSTPAEQLALKRLFSLALYVDRAEDAFMCLGGYAYDPQFTQHLLEQDSLARWQGLGVYLGCCRYAHVYLGFGGFFNHVIAPAHVPYIYGRMLILALFYQLTLRHYNRRISCATMQLWEHSKTSEFRQLRKDFIQFTNNYWFHEVTTQTQGLEIFALQTKSLGVDAEYHLIKDEMERADEYSNVLRSETLTRGASFVAIASLLTSVFLAFPLNLGVVVFESFNHYTLSIGVAGFAVLYLIWLWFKNK